VFVLNERGRIKFDRKPITKIIEPITWIWTRPGRVGLAIPPSRSFISVSNQPSTKRINRERPPPISASASCPAAAPRLWIAPRRSHHGQSPPPSLSPLNLFLSRSLCVQRSVQNYPSFPPQSPFLARSPHWGSRRAAIRRTSVPAVVRRPLGCGLVPGRSNWWRFGPDVRGCYDRATPSEEM
jgi:hypothetical protein